MDGPDCIWITHPSFRALSEDHLQAIIRYFGSTDKSNGGEIVDTQKVSPGKDELTALLIKFKDQTSAETVISREHRLVDIFHSDKFTPEQVLEVKSQCVTKRPDSSLSSNSPSAMDMESQASAGASWVVLDDTESGDQPTLKIEIYEFPDDLVPIELLDHFVAKFNAQSQTRAEEMEEEFEKSGIFTLEFKQTDAEKILEQPEQILEEDDDEKIMIKIRAANPPPPQIRAVHFHCDAKINTRMVKKSLKDYEVESCQMMGDSKTDVIVVFKSAEDAEKVVGGTKLHKVTSTITAGISLHEAEQTEKLPDTKPTVTSEEMTGTKPKHPASLDEERPETPMSTSTASSSMTLDLDMSGEHEPRSKSPEMGDKKAAERQISSRTLTPSPLTLGKNASDDKPFTYIEIEESTDYQAEDMYELIKLQLECVLGEEYRSVTEYKHSYDSHKKVFRFDMSAADIRKFLEKGPHFFEDDVPESQMRITPKADDPVITVRILSNPKKKVLTEKVLKSEFGTESKLSNKLQVLSLDKNVGALLQMENSAVAALIVAAGKHKLPGNMILEASFDLTLIDSLSSATELKNPASPAVNELSGPAANKAVLITMTEPISKLLFKKYMNKLQGTAERTEDGKELLITFNNVEDAEMMVEQSEVDILSKKGIARFYVPPADTIIETESTHVEIVCKLIETESAKDLHILITEHLNELFDEGCTETKFEHSFDDVKKVFRYDLKPEEILLLMSKPQQLFDDTPDSVLEISEKKTGKTVLAKVLSEVKGQRLSKTQLKQALGPRSPLMTSVEITEINDDQATLEFETCSVASKLVSLRKHELKNGMTIEISFHPSNAGDDDSNEDSGETRTHEQKDRKDEPIQVPTAAPRKVNRNKPNQPRNAALAGFESTERQIDERVPTAKPTETLLIHNLLDVDEETLSYWVKSITGLWPISIHMSESEEKAVVKVPLVDRGLEWSTLQKRLDGVDYHLHGERLRMERVHSSQSIQVMVVTKNKGPLHVDHILSYFSDSRRLGVSPDGEIAARPYMDRENIYTVTYPSHLDVAAVMNKKPHKHAEYNFEIAEHYEGVGLCKPRGLRLFSYYQESSSDAMIKPSLSINDIRQSDLKNLRLKMADKGRSKGDEIESFITIKKSNGTVKVKITYVDDSVAEGVYQAHRKRPITVNNRELHIELELPTLLEYHDNQSIRLSGLTPDLDPEKLKFYISALADCVATEIWFDSTRTKAVTKFSQPIDFGWVLCHQRTTSINECPDIRIHQEDKPACLLAVGTITKDDIELQLEALLKPVVDDKDYQIEAERMEDTDDKWKIKVGYQGMSLKKMQQTLQPGCTQLSIYSEHLGLNVTTGAYKKTKNLSEILMDIRVIKFILDGKMPLFEKLGKYLQDRSFTLSADGTITLNLGTDNKKNRIRLQNWRSINQLIEKFVQTNCLIYQTETLTEQVYSELVPKVRNLTKSLKVIFATISAKQSAHPGANQLSVVGEKQTIENLTVQIEKLIKAEEKKIQEELAVRTVVVPNIKEYQIDYLEQSEFFKDMKQAFNLRSITPDRQNERVTITGVPSTIDKVQKKMFDILPKLSKSRCAESKKPLFLKVLQTTLAKESLSKEFLNKRLVAVWTLENRTINMYSENKDKARLAMDSLNELIWEAEYPSNRNFDDLEKQLLTTALWRDKKAELMKVAEPLQIVQFGDRPALSLVGLKHQKAHVLEEIPYFFEQNVERQSMFQGKGKRVSYLLKYNTRLLDDLASEFKTSVKRGNGNNSEVIEITGTSNAIANTTRAIKAAHDSVRQGEFHIDVPAMVQHIKDDSEILESVGDKTKCVITLHEDEEDFETSHSMGIEAMGGFAGYRTVLPSGATCTVKKGDITSVKCDAIVNAANEDLQHCGGLAHAIVQRGGDSIQQECNWYVRRHGKLMVGEAMSSDSGSLPCKKIIHAVGPRWNGGRKDEVLSLERCIESCFEQMAELKLCSIVIPPISTGIFMFPLDLAAKTIIKTILKLDSKRGLCREVILMDNKDDKSLQLFEKELRAGNKSVAPLRTSPKSGTDIDNSAQIYAVKAPQNTAPAKYSIIGKNVSVLRRVNLEVVSGDITSRQEDSLVNSVGTDMNLAQGKVAPVIAMKAGPQLQQDCNNLQPIRHGEVKATSGHQMPCKQILHCCLPHWGGPASVQALKLIVNDCLMQAAALGHTSIAFPALGTGNLRYPEQNVARCMIETVVDYTEKNPNSSIKDVKIVVFHMDQRTMLGFEAVLFAMKNPSSSSNATGSQSKLNLSVQNPRSTTRQGAGAHVNTNQKTTVVGGVKVNDTLLRVVKGSITDHDAEIIVNSTDDRLSMGGNVARALQEKGGHSFTQEVERLALKGSSNGIWVSSAGAMTAKFVLHLDSHTPRDSAAKWSKAISHCLSECDLRGVTSIAFPALGTGVLKIPPKTMSKLIFEAVCTYVNKNPETWLKAIDIVIFQPNMVDDFEKSMKTAIKSQQKPKGFLARISGWLSSGLNILSGGSSSISLPPTATGRGITRQQKSISFGTAEEHISLDIYSDSEEKILQCKKELEQRLQKALVTMFWKDKPTYNDDKELIKQLTNEQISCMQDEAVRLSVKLDVNPRLQNIKIEGRPEDVSKMSDLIVKELSDIKKGLAEEKEEQLLAKAIQWSFADREGVFTRFDAATNKLLEEAFIRNPNAIMTYKTSDGVEAKVDLSTKLGDYKGTQFKLTRDDLSKPKVIGAELPKSWVTPIDVYQEHVVTPGTPEFVKVEANFSRTLGQVQLQQGVLEIRRVQNPPLYQQYVILRKAVAKKWNKSEDQVETLPLWHGTDQDTVSKITAGKFDRGLAGKNATAFGCGSYFARESAYSCRYAKQNGNGEMFIIQTRVITGEYIKGDNSMKAAPYKNPALQYDSVVNDANNPSIYVVFHDVAAYPEYIIKFR